MRFSATPFLRILTIAAVASGCGGSSNPTGPQMPATQIFISCPEFGESSRCNAHALLEDGNSLDVTGLADWTVSDRTIGSITSTGLVTATTTGEIAIRASYGGVTSAVIRWAVPNNGLHGIDHTLNGTVGSLGGPLPGVLMEILTGPNAGRSTTTSATGFFYMEGLQDGQFTIRLSKAGYRTAEYTWWIPGGSNRMPTLTAQ